jgi:parallel beta-helix repeat protein
MLAIDGNVISDNGSHGVEILGIDGKQSSVINNKIGTDAAGTANLGNGGEGVWFVQSAHDNRVTNNTIAFNSGRGIFVQTGAGLANELSQNAIFSNGGLGIDLGAVGVTPNDNLDLDSGPNGLQNFPVLTKVDRNPNTGQTSIDVLLNSTPLTGFLFEFFANDTADSSGHGEGKRFLSNAQRSTDASGNVSFQHFDGTLAAGEFVTASVSTFDGNSFTRENTSEFSAAVIVADVTAPTVMNVIIHHSANKHAEYTVPVGTGALQLKTVPVGGANQVKIIFSEQVTVAQNDLVLKGRSPSGVITTFAFSSFTQGAGPGVGQWFAEWTTTQSFGVNQMAIRLESGAGGVRDLAGNDLNGFWDNPVDLNDNTSDTFPSGSELNPGQDFVFSYTALAGDADQSNHVDVEDLNRVRNNFGMTMAVWSDGDVTGDGVVNTDDLNEVRNNFGQTITTSWDGTMTLVASGGGPPHVIGEAALRAFLADLVLTLRASDDTPDSFDGLIGWELLGDDEWWETLREDRD